MELLTRCERCGAVYKIGKVSRLPAPSRLMEQLAVTMDTHFCPKGVDKPRRPH